MALLIENYQPAGPTIRDFHLSTKRHRVLIGPIGSGKTTGCMQELYKLITRMPAVQGVRRSRWAIIRATTPELQFTTIPQWRSMFDDRFGPWQEGSKGKPTAHNWRFKRPDDGSIVDAEIWFAGLDDAAGVAKITGALLTGALFSELRHQEKEIYRAVRKRCGRYPATFGEDDGSFWGTIADTNPPDQDHWLFKLCEEARPANLGVFKQPGGVIKVGDQWVLNPLAENLANLRKGYYEEEIQGLGEDEIRVDYGGEYGFVAAGRPIYPEYQDSVHCAREPLRPVPGLPIDIGMDFGRTPAAVFGQRLPIGRSTALRELVTTNMGAPDFFREIRRILNAEFKGFKIGRMVGDPAGEQLPQTGDETVYDIARAHGFDMIEPAETNDPTIRREAVAGGMKRLAMDGKPGLLISPTCTTLRKGYAGGYGFRRMKIAGAERYRDVPDKTIYSHVCEADQYRHLGYGEGERVLTGEDPVERERRWEREAAAEDDFDPLRW